MEHQPTSFAWDKHDFRVANNKGGDVQVAVNLAAPITNSGNRTSHHRAKMWKSLSDVLQQQRKSRANVTDMMHQFMNGLKESKSHAPALDLRSLIGSLKTQLRHHAPPPSIDISGLKAVLKDIARPQMMMPPPPPGGLRINVEHQAPMIVPPVPPPPPPQQMDPMQLVREVMQTVHMPPPQPVQQSKPDPAIQALVSQIAELKEMKQMMEKVIEKSAPQAPCPPPAPAPPPQIIINVPKPDFEMPPPPPPPPPPMNSYSSSISKEDLQNFMTSISKPPVIPLPAAAGPNKEIQELRELIMQQSKAVQQGPPIILPPPVVEHKAEAPAATPVPLPPIPPLPSMSKEIIGDLIKGMQHEPARIPAPPVFNITEAGPVIVQPCINCGAAPPAPVEPEVKCERVEGSPIPRCKREPPKGIKCKRKEPSTLTIVGEAPPDEDDDAECDTEDIPVLAKEPIEECPDCNKPGKITQAEFNPKMLLDRLCAGGKCAQFNDRMAVANGDTVVPPPSPYPNGGFLKPATGSM